MSNADTVSALQITGKRKRPRAQWWGNVQRPPAWVLNDTAGELLTNRARAVLGADAVRVWEALVDTRLSVDDWLTWTDGVRDLVAKKTGLPPRTLRSAIDRLEEAQLVESEVTRVIYAPGSGRRIVVGRGGVPKLAKHDTAPRWGTVKRVRVHGAVGLYRGEVNMWVPTGVLAWCAANGRGGARPTRARMLAAEIMRHFQARRAGVEELAELYGRTAASIRRIVQFIAGNQNRTQPDRATKEQVVSSSKTAVSSLNSSLYSASSSKKHPLASKPASGTPPASPVTAQQTITKPTPLQVARQLEAKLRAAPPTRDGKPEPVADLVLWQVSGRQLGDWRAYARLRAAELAQGCVDPLTRYAEALRPPNAL